VALSDPFPLNITNGSSKSFQEAKAVNIATVACIGFDNGKIIFQNIFHVLAPSIYAASSKLIGIFFKYPTYRRTLIDNWKIKYIKTNPMILSIFRKDNCFTSGNINIENGTNMALIR